MSFKVIRQGFYTTVQDAGRFGFADRGLAKSGVMDEHAYRWANYLLHNHQHDAVLEITIGNCILEAQAETTIAITGADMQFSINGEEKENWHSHTIKPGDQLRWQSATSGVRAYLAVKGGLQTEQVFNSRSTNVREKIGSKLQAGDDLPYIASTKVIANRFVPLEYQPDYQKPLHLHLLPSYQFDLFSAQQVKAFFKNSYQITQNSDRTGYRLSGEVIKAVPANMTSEGMAVGSVEVTTAGLPIILMNDAPTMGGYPKIGTVVSEDLAKLAQRPTNTEVKFTLTTIEETQRRKREWLSFFSSSVAPR